VKNCKVGKKLPSREKLQRQPNFSVGLNFFTPFMCRGSSLKIGGFSGPVPPIAGWILKGIGCTGAVLEAKNR